MKIIHLLKPGLFIYEVFRMLLLAITLILQANNTSIFMMIVLAAPGVLFPLMALFICLNTVRYREYFPLYIAGKSIVIFTLLSWFLFSQQITVISGILSGMTLLSCDLFSLSVILYIKKDDQKSTETPAVIDTNELKVEEN